MSKFVAILTGLMAFGCASAQAAITLAPGASPYFSVPSVIDFSPSGFSMAGMRVTVHFAGGGSEQVFWQATTTIAGQAVGASVPGWRLEESGDTFGPTSLSDPTNTGIWYLYNETGLAITKLVLEGSGPGFGGKTLFDVQGDGSDGNGTVPGKNPSASAAPPHKGTLGSELGSSFEDLNGSVLSSVYANLATSLSVNAAYINAVQLDSASGPLGDLFTTLEISFGPSGLLPTSALASIGITDVIPYQFRADTDLWGVGTVVQEPVPEPGSFALLAGLGSLAMAYARGRRQLVNRR